MSERDYAEFLRAKVRMAESLGFDIDPGEINPILKPHQRLIVQWAVAGGRRAIFAAFGLGKTVIGLETVRLTRARAGGMGLIVIPLGVRSEFMRDAAMLGLTVTFVRRIEECTDPDGIYLTNYETVRDGKLDPRRFSVALLDEAACLRGFGGTKTFREFMALFAGDDRRDHLNARHRTNGVPYRFVATATPSPNEYIELLAYSAYLGIMDVGQAKTRFFKRNSEKADQLTIHPHKEREFWLWMASWALFVQKPSDLGCPDDGYVLPALNVHWHELASDHSAAGADKSGQSLMFREVALGVVSASREKRDTLGARVAQTVRIIKEVIGWEDQAQNIGASTTLRIESGGSRISATHTTATEKSGSPPTSDAAKPEIEKRLASTSASTICATSNDTESEARPFSSADTDSTNNSSSKCLNRKAAHAESAKRAQLVNADSISTTITQPAWCEESSATDATCSSAAIRTAPEILAQRDTQQPPDTSKQQFVVWVDLNDEQRSIESALSAEGITCSSLFGAQELDHREALLQRWRDRETRVFLSKPSMYGAGVNLQQSHTMVFAGIGFKFAEFVQAVHRIHRFLQASVCDVHLVYTEAEREVRRSLERKWQQHNELVQQMTNVIREFGLSEAAMAHSLTRKLGVERVEVRGDGYTLVNEDAVKECARMAESSVGLILTSVPFSTQYEYSPNYADFGHTDTNAHFFEQMDFLTPELLRVLQPGRVAAIHVKDRIVPGGMTGLGFQTVYPFHARCIEHYTQHGFAYLGMKTIVTDVVRENNQTYRLGWTEQCKDATKMGVGMPEYLLLFRKPPSSSERSYADLPVVKSKERYTRSRWQIDAHGFTRSCGNRLLTPDELKDLPHDAIFKLFRDFSLHSVYDFEHHVRVGEELESEGRLPVTFMLLQPASWSPDVWSDITRMLTLNGAQSAAGKEMHLCPLQFDIADRVIEQFSMPGEVVLDPFAGLMTVPYRAILAKRRAIGIELSPAYFADGVGYCEAAARQMAMPTLFDLEAAA